MKARIRLLEQDPNKVENVSMYIRELRTAFRDTLLENLIYREEATLPTLCKISSRFNYSPLAPTHWYFNDKEPSYLFCTITFDPRKFPQLIVASQEEQKKYIEQVLTLSIEADKLSTFYGVYELQKNGNIHYHFITPLYDKIILKEWLTPFFTDRKENKYAVDVKPVTNMEGLIKDYLLKAPVGVCHNISNYDIIYETLDL